MQTQIEIIDYRGFTLTVKEQALMGFYCEVFEEDIHHQKLELTGYYFNQERAVELTKKKIDEYLTRSI